MGCWEKWKKPTIIITIQIENQCKDIFFSFFLAVFIWVTLPFSFMHIVWALVIKHEQEKLILTFVCYGCAFHFPAGVLHSKTGLLGLLQAAHRTLLTCSCAETSGQLDLKALNVCMWIFPLVMLAWSVVCSVGHCFSGLSSGGLWCLLVSGFLFLSCIFKKKYFLPLPVRLEHTWTLYLVLRNGKLLVLSCLVSFSVIRENFFENSAVPEGNIKIKTIFFKIGFPPWIYNQTPNTCAMDPEVWINPQFSCSIS